VEQRGPDAVRAERTPGLQPRPDPAGGGGQDPDGELSGGDGDADTTFDFGCNDPRRAEKLAKNRREWRKRRAAVYRKACEIRDWLRKEMGGECEECGDKDDLHFHHPKGRDWAPASKNLLQRMKLYLRDYIDGRLMLLCRSCNCSDGQARLCLAKLYLKPGRKRRRR
jgi:hypothetical protein